MQQLSADEFENNKSAASAKMTLKDVGRTAFSPAKHIDGEFSFLK